MVDGAHGVYGHSVHNRAWKNSRTMNRFAKDIDDAIHLFHSWAVDRVLAMKLSIRFAVFHFVQLMGDGRAGTFGVRVQQLAELEPKCGPEIVTIRQRVMAAHIVKGIIVKVPFVQCSRVQVISDDVALL